MQRSEEIVNFWFEGVNYDRVVLERSNPAIKKWFQKNRDFDRLIASRFEPDIQKASGGIYDDWKETPRGILAFIILTDQFPRNIYRNTARSFAFDRHALAACRQAIRQTLDQELSLIERQFCYMPLMHSESLDDQREALTQFRRLADHSRTVNPANTDYFEYTFGFARRHHDIIRQFGRFPHRNAILGRPNTAAEEDFLKKPGSSF